MFEYNPVITIKHYDCVSNLKMITPLLTRNHWYTLLTLTADDCKYDHHLTHAKWLKCLRFNFIDNFQLLRIVFYKMLSLLLYCIISTVISPVSWPRSDLSWWRAPPWWTHQDSESSRMLSPAPPAGMMWRWFCSVSASSSWRCCLHQSCQPCLPDQSLIQSLVLVIQKVNLVWEHHLTHHDPRGPLLLVWSLQEVAGDWSLLDPWCWRWGMVWNKTWIVTGLQELTAEVETRLHSCWRHLAATLHYCSWK